MVGKEFMKKLLVIMFQDFESPFGAARKYSEMIEYLTNHYEIILLCLNSPKNINILKIYKMRFFPPHKRDLKSMNFSTICIKYIYFYLFQVFTVLKIIVLHRDIRFVHIRHDTYSWPSALLLYIFGKRMIADGKVFSTYAIEHDARLKLISDLMIVIEYNILKLYWKFCVYSDNFKKELIDFGFDESRIFFILPSINRLKIPFFPITENNLYNICYFGELFDYSNVLILIKAFEKIKQQFSKSKLLIIGSGECYDSLKKYASNLAIKEDVVFTGRLSPDALYKQFQNFSILVNPTVLFAGTESIKRIEALIAGKVILEAKPVGHSNNNPIIFFNGNNSDDLFEKIYILFLTPSLIYMYSRKSRIASKKYDITNYELLINLIEENST